MSSAKIRFLIISALSFAIGLVAMASQALATEPWQFVQGDRYGFVLPDRPMGSQTSFDFIMLSKTSQAIPPLTNPIGEAKQRCPETASIIEHIYKKIIVKNHLQEFLKTGPGFQLHVTCNDDREYAPAGYSVGAYASMTHLVFPSSLVRGLNTEDEIAFVIAHEMSHVLMGHTENLLDINEWGRTINYKKELFEPKMLEVTAFSESQADKYAAFLMWNAGYRVACAQNALENYTRFYLGTIMNFLSRFMGDDGHGSARARQQRLMSEVMVPAKMELTCPKTKSASILRARAKIKERESR